jgi:repressor LexA
MTSTRLKILFWIQRYCEEKGYSPTLRELCVAFHWSSPNAAKQYLDGLAKAGMVRRQERIARTLTLTPAGLDVLERHTAGLTQ